MFNVLYPPTPYKQPMYVLYNSLVSISCATWRWPLSSAETCSCTMRRKYFIFYQYSCVRPVHALYISCISYFIEHNGNDEPHDKTSRFYLQTVTARILISYFKFRLHNSQTGNLQCVAAFVSRILAVCSQQSFLGTSRSLSRISEALSSYSALIFANTQHWKPYSAFTVVTVYDIQ